jgi:hypothetical protein
LGANTVAIIKALQAELNLPATGVVDAGQKSESKGVNLVEAKHAAGEIKLPIEVSEIAGAARLNKSIPFLSQEQITL